MSAARATETQRQAAAERKRRQRQRRREGVEVAIVEVPSDLTQLLVMRDHLAPEDVGKPGALDAAVSSYLREQADEI